MQASNGEVPSLSTVQYIESYEQLSSFLSVYSHKISHYIGIRYNEQSSPLYSRGTA